MEGGRKGRSGTGCLQRTLIHQGPAPPGAQTFCGCHCPLPRHLQAELLVQRMDKVALVQVGVRQGRGGGALVRVVGEGGRGAAATIPGWGCTWRLVLTAHPTLYTLRVHTCRAIWVFAC